MFVLIVIYCCRAMDSLKLPKPRQLSEPHGMDASLDSQMNAHSTMETIPFQLQGSNDAGIPLGYCLEVILGLGQLLEKDNVCASYLLKCKELSIVMKARLTNSFCMVMLTTRTAARIF